MFISNNEAKKGGVIGRQGLYAHVSKYTVEAVDCLYELMKSSRNEGIRLGAAKAILDKSLPDMKATELVSQNTEPLIIKIVEGKDYYDNK